MDQAVLVKEREKGGPVVRAFRWVFIYPGAVVLLWLFIDSLWRTGHYDIDTYLEQVLLRTDRVWLNLLVLAAVLAGMALLAGTKAAGWLERLPLEDMLAFGMGAAGLIWVLLVRASDPVGEAGNVAGAAQEIWRGNTWALQQGGYLDRFPYQLGYVAFLELIYRVFGYNNHIVPQVVNVVALVVCYKALVGITRELFEDAEITRVVCLLGFFSWYLIPYTTFIYAILPGMALGLAAFWAALRYMDSGRLSQLVAAVACSGLATVFKSNFMIFCIALALVLILEGLRGRRMRYLAAAACFLLVSIAAPALLQKAYEWRTGYQLNGMPSVSWVAMGLSDDSTMGPGWYNHMTYDLYDENEYDLKAVQAAAVERIGERLRIFAADPLYAADFFLTKNATQWNEPTFGGLQTAYWSLPKPEFIGAFMLGLFKAPRLNGLIVGVMGMFQMVVYFGAAAALWMKRKVWRLPQLLPLVAMLGGFACHTLWEAKSQYIVQYFFLLIPYGAAGLVWLARGPVPMLWGRVLRLVRRKAAKA